MGRRVTLEDIAKALGLHRSTVCLALQNNANVAEKTRRRVAETAQRLGYRPDPALSQLASNRWQNQQSGHSLHNLSYVVHPEFGKPSEERFSQVKYFDAANKRAKELGYHLEMFDLSDYPTSQAATRTLQARGIRGLVVGPIPDPESQISLDLDWEHFTAVCCSAGRIRPDLHTVSDDPFLAIRMAWQNLVERGYGRIGPVLFQHEPVAEHDYLRYGALLAEQQICQECDSLPILKCDFYDREAFYQWFEIYRPDVVLGFHSHVYDWITDCGLRVPEDVGFCSLHVYPKQKVRSISGIDQMVEAIGVSAVELLVEQIRANEWGLPKLQRLISLGPRWVEGDTVRAPA